MDKWSFIQHFMIHAEIHDQPKVVAHGGDKFDENLRRANELYERIKDKREAYTTMQQRMRILDSLRVMQEGGLTTALLGYPSKAIVEMEAQGLVVKDPSQKPGTRPYKTKWLATSKGQDYYNRNRDFDKWVH